MRAPAAFILLFGAIGFLMSDQRLVAVTDRSISVFEATMNGNKPRKLMYQVPRATQMGPAKGGMYKKITTGRETLRIHRAWANTVAQPDAAVAAPPVATV